MRLKNETPTTAILDFAPVFAKGWLRQGEGGRAISRVTSLRQGEPGRGTRSDAVLLFCLFAPLSTEKGRKIVLCPTPGTHLLLGLRACRTEAASLYLPGLILGSTRCYKQSNC